MNRQEWVERIPVSVTQVGRWKVSIYDQAAYDESLRQFPDDNATNEKPVTGKANNATSQFKKGKPAARYNWTKRIKTPLPLTANTKEKTA